ncbi:MAG: hypothetical protein RRY95_06685 [Oscillospiraceae bacterium]
MDLSRYGRSGGLERRKKEAPALRQNMKKPCNLTITGFFMVAEAGLEPVFAVFSNFLHEIMHCFVLK